MNIEEMKAKFITTKCLGWQNVDTYHVMTALYVDKNIRKECKALSDSEELKAYYLKTLPSQHLFIDCVDFETIHNFIKNNDNAIGVGLILPE